MICYDYINDYIRKTMPPQDGLLAELEGYAGEHHVPVIHPEVARFLSVIGAAVKPSRILEIGTAIGYSAILLSKILRAEGKLDTIERNETMILEAKKNIKRAGMEDTIHVMIGDAAEVLRCLDKKYDLVFMDAAKGQYLEFLPECLRLLSPGGVLISDNILYKGMVATDDLVVHRKITIVKNMRDYLDTLCHHPQLETSLIPMGDGVAVSYRKL